MVQYTPRLQLPYVQGSDTPITYPTTSQDLATKLDAASPLVVKGTTPAPHATFDLGAIRILIARTAGEASNASGVVTIVFPVVLPRIPFVIMVLPADDWTADLIAPKSSSYSTTGFQFTMWTHAGTPHGSTGLFCSYLAIC